MMAVDLTQLRQEVEKSLRIYDFAKMASDVSRRRFEEAKAAFEAAAKEAGTDVTFDDTPPWKTLGWRKDADAAFEAVATVAAA